MFARKYDEEEVCSSSRLSWSFISERSFSMDTPNYEEMQLPQWEQFDLEDVIHGTPTMPVPSPSVHSQAPVGEQLTISQLGDAPVASNHRQSRSHRNGSQGRTQAHSNTSDSQNIRSVGPSSGFMEVFQNTIFFNQALYGSLRMGGAVDFFSKEYSGLAFSAAATGFVFPFVETCFQPLLCTYLGFTYQQTNAANMFYLLPGILNFIVGVCSDFYSFWGFNRKSYIIGGWIYAYLMLMLLVLFVLIDDTSSTMTNNIRTFCGGIIYVLLLMGVSFGATIASVASFAFVVELSQRESIYERGHIAIKYILIRESFTWFAYIASSLILAPQPNGTLQSNLSMKIVTLILALVTLIPIPAVVFRLQEDSKEEKIEPMFRSCLFIRLWRILQQNAVWRIIIFSCGTFFFLGFYFQVAEKAVRFWSTTTPQMELYDMIPLQLFVVFTIVVYRRWFFNYSWIRLTVGSILFYIGVRAITAFPIVLGLLRDEYYYMIMMSLTGFSKAVGILVTILPILEITENGFEGATTGLVASYNVLIIWVVHTFCDGVTSFHGAFSYDVLSQDTSGIRRNVVLLLLLNYGINALAIIPVIYLLPEQRLEAQQLRSSSGGSSRLAGIIILAICVILVISAGTMNIIALTHGIY